MKNKWNKLTIYYKVSMFLILLGLITMIIGLILIGTAKYSNLLSNGTGFEFLSKNGIGYVINHSSAPTGYNFSSAMWTQLQAGVIFAVIVTPVLFGLVIFTIIIGFFSLSNKK